MIKTPLSTVIGGAFWTPGAVQIGSSSKNLSQLIKSLFSLGEQVFAYDPNDLTTLYQDAAGAIPVTAAGQPVGLVKDKSGRNNHAYQTVSASRPILQRNEVTGAYYLAFDGVDDFLQTNNIDFTATDKVSLFAGIKEVSSGIQVIAELGADTATNQGTYLFSLEGSKYTFKSRGSVNLVAVQSASTQVVTVPDLSVVSARGNISGDSNTIKRNGINGSPSTGDLGLGNYGNHPLYIGRRAGTSLPFNGHLYSLIIVGRLTTDNETKRIESELAKLTGVTLNV
jgi:hypothetical protein